jgi:hypothetical protein
MPENDHFADDFNSYFWMAALASCSTLLGLDAEGTNKLVFLGLGGFAGLIWLLASMFGGNTFYDKRKAHQRLIPWLIWGVLGGISGVAAFIGFKAGVAELRQANLSPANQIIIGMLAVIIVLLFYIGVELERIRKRSTS